jgi:thiosulfate dehydrogenase [quinone] large subunit
VRPTPTQWATLPLRLFLGVTFTYAGLQKLANPAYLNGRSPTSVQSVIHSLQHGSPIGFLLGASAHAPVLVGLLIALGEVAVGVATLLGFWVRLAALGGLLLALTFFLTVSWNTTPYYYGSDIVFVFAWTVPLIAGTWPGFTLDDVIRRRAMSDPDPQRRALVIGGSTAGALAVAVGATAGVVAAVGRALHHSSQPRATTPPPTHPAPVRPSTSGGTTRLPGTHIAKAADVPVGQAVGFRDPSSNPAGLVHEPDGAFRAFSAVCTHAGCTVEFDGGQGAFICPCHGGAYAATTGDVLAGPPPAPLRRLPVEVVNGDVRLV